MISIEVGEPDSNWNKRLLDSGLGTIYQTKEWASIITNLGWEPIFLKFIDQKGQIVAQLLVTTISRLDKKITVKNILKKIPGLKKMVYKWTYGPIVFNSEFHSDIYSSLGDFLLSKNCKVAGSQHPLCSDGVSILKKKFQLEMWSTFLIDLHKTKDELYDNINKHSGRKNIERSINRGVVVEEITEKSLVEYNDLLNKTRIASGREESKLNDAYEWWRILKPLGYSGFLAKKDNVAIGGLLFSFFNNYIIEGGVARSEYDTKNKLYSQDLIKWRIIEWGIQNKMNYYDLAGANPQPESEKEKGILRYKEKWGGKRYDYWIIKW
jgi:lipid II:glycine glycyltransferase (peptidoglycan interpeptide bridge formation enzyme)